MLHHRYYGRILANSGKAYDNVYWSVDDEPRSFWGRDIKITTVDLSSTLAANALILVGDGECFNVIEKE
jgi:hypothetical protein